MISPTRRSDNPIPHGDCVGADNNSIPNEWQTAHRWVPANEVALSRSIVSGYPMNGSQSFINTCTYRLGWPEDSNLSIANLEKRQTMIIAVCFCESIGMGKNVSVAIACSGGELRYLLTIGLSFGPDGRRHEQFWTVSCIGSISTFRCHILQIRLSVATSACPKCICIFSTASADNSSPPWEISACFRSA